VIRLAEYIAKHYRGKVVEVGIGNYWRVAEYLAKAGFEVIAIDLKPINLKANLKFYIDDITNPNMEIYEGASLIYSIRPPPELVKSILRVARAVNADCIVKPLYGDYFDGKLVNFKGLSFYIWAYKIYR